MFAEVEGFKDIQKESAKVLLRAEALGHFPTPIDEIVAAAGLTEVRGDDSWLARGALARAPKGIQKLFAKVTQRVVGLLDRREKEVHLDPEMAATAHGSFVRLHEVGHDIIPWQRDLYEVDDDLALSPTVRALFEQQANVAASEMLFQGEEFARVAADSQVGLAVVIATSQQFGGSIRAGLRRYVETHRAELCMIVLPAEPYSILPLEFGRHESIVSSTFASRFGEAFYVKKLTAERFSFVPDAAASIHQPRTILSTEWTKRDRRGEEVVLKVEVMHTGYNVLVLAWVPFSQRTRRRLRLAS